MRDSRGKQMAKFTQATLNQVAGFDAQILAQNLIYDQKDFWNFEWSTITSYTSGWQTGTTPVDLTGATINAQIVRRAITDFQDSRTGLDFTIQDYPLVPLITTITSAETTNDTFTCTTTADLFVDQPVQFVGAVFGGVAINTTYFVKTIITETTFTISATQGGGIFNLTTASGTMRMNRVAPTPIVLPISNINTSAGTFTMTIDDDTWDLIAGDPDLNINADEPACFTGRVKISFPSVGTQPAYDQAVFLLFLVNSDGVINY
jgi:hypothetical protein